MRIFTSAFLISAMLAFAGSASAQSSAADEQATAPPAQGDFLDTLYQSLKRTGDADRAAALAREIDEYLDRSPSATVSLLIEWSDEAENSGRTASALDFLSEAIALRPDEAAAYRKRALLHYTHGDLHEAMDDIRTSLTLEPRDFGALGLMATILDRVGRQEAAIAVWRRYLALYPADREVSSFVEETENAMAGKRI